MDHGPDNAARPRRRRWRWLLGSASLLLSLLAVEVGCRVFAWRADLRAREAWERLDQLRPAPAGDVDFGHIVRRSADPRIVYELLPNLTGVTFMGASLSTDSHGCRGPERPVEKPPGALRIVALGDSVAFGWGVEEPETMLRLLETRLRAALPDRQVDLINTAVPGYNTAMEVAVLEAKGLQFRPDMVIIDYCGNDTDLPNVIWHEHDFWTLRRSFLWDLAARSIEAHDPWREGGFDPAPVTADRARFENDPDRVPARYRDMVGWSGWRRAMERLVALGRQEHFFVIVTAGRQIDPYVTQTCQELGLPLFGATTCIDDYMRAHGIENYYRSPLTRNEHDPHPTALHHRLQFESLWSVVERYDLLKVMFAPRK